MNKIYACYSYLTKYFPNYEFVFRKLAFLSQPDFLVKAKAILQHLNFFEVICNALVKPSNWTYCEIFDWEKSRKGMDLLQYIQMQLKMISETFYYTPFNSPSRTTSHLQPTALHQPYSLFQSTSLVTLQLSFIFFGKNPKQMSNKVETGNSPKGGSLPKLKSPQIKMLTTILR